VRPAGRIPADVDDVRAAGGAREPVFDGAVGVAGDPADTRDALYRGLMRPRRLGKPLRTALIDMTQAAPASCPTAQ
jgi:hypothetical protein